MVNANRPDFPSWLVRHQRTHEAFLSQKKSTQLGSEPKQGLKQETQLDNFHAHFFIPEGTLGSKDSR